MACKLSTRRELLDRWRGIEEEEEDEDDDRIDSSTRRRLHQHKEQWFLLSLSLFSFLRFFHFYVEALFFFSKAFSVHFNFFLLN